MNDSRNQPSSQSNPKCDSKIGQLESSSLPFLLLNIANSRITNFQDDMPDNNTRKSNEATNERCYQNRENKSLTIENSIFIQQRPTFAIMTLVKNPASRPQKIQTPIFQINPAPTPIIVPPTTVPNPASQIPILPPFTSNRKFLKSSQKQILQYYKNFYFFITEVFGKIQVILPLQSQKTADILLMGKSVQTFFDQIMGWNFNFCLPALPNDPTIEFHRDFQTGTLCIALVFYVFVHSYYVFCGPEPLEEEIKTQFTPKPKSKPKLELAKSERKQKNSSCPGQMGQDGNQSYISFKKKKQQQPDSLPTEGKQIVEIHRNITAKDIQQNFPIVFGHFSIMVGMSTLYSPYFQESIGIALYFLLSIGLTISAALNKKSLTRIIWTLMCTVLISVSTCSIIQLGQANYSLQNERCFTNEYQSPY